MPSSLLSNELSCILDDPARMSYLCEGLLNAPGRIGYPLYPSVYSLVTAMTTVSTYLSN